MQRKQAEELKGVKAAKATRDARNNTMRHVYKGGCITVDDAHRRIRERAEEEAERERQHSLKKAAKVATQSENTTQTRCTTMTTTAASLPSNTNKQGPQVDDVIQLERIRCLLGALVFCPAQRRHVQS